MSRKQAAEYVTDRKVGVGEVGTVGKWISREYLKFLAPYLATGARRFTFRALS